MISTWRGVCDSPIACHRPLKRRKRRAPERGLQPASPHESRPATASHSTFRISTFGFVSDFGFRISDFNRGGIG
jgi:hypothetical protein